MDEKKQLVKQELYQAIAFFIERQQLVAQAILDFGLDLEAIGNYGALAWVSSVSHIVKDVEKIYDLFPEGSNLHDVAKRAEDIRVPQEGVWTDPDHDKWEYYLHGSGCRLTNARTRECIDWDCPDVEAFDDFFFQNHLEWQLQSSNRKDKLKHTQTWVNSNGINSIRSLIKEMIDEGIIREHPNPLEWKYALRENPMQNAG